MNKTTQMLSFTGVSTGLDDFDPNEATGQAIAKCNAYLTRHPEHVVKLMTSTLHGGGNYGVYVLTVLVERPVSEADDQHDD